MVLLPLVRSRVSARRPSYLWHCPKVTKRLAPAARLFPPVLALKRAPHKSPVARHGATLGRASGLMVRRLDRINAQRFGAGKRGGALRQSRTDRLVCCMSRSMTAGLFTTRRCAAISRVSARRPSYFWHFPKVTKRLAPAARLFPPVLALKRAPHKSPVARHGATLGRASGLMVRRMDRFNAARFGAGKRGAVRLPYLHASAIQVAHGRAGTARFVSIGGQRPSYAANGPFCPPRGAEWQAVQDQNHEPTARGSAPSGDLFWSRLPRAPQGTGGQQGLASLPTFWAMPESRSAAGPRPGLSTWGVTFATVTIARRRA